MDAGSSDVTRYTTLLYSLVGIKKKQKKPFILWMAEKGKTVPSGKVLIFADDANVYT